MSGLSGSTYTDKVGASSPQEETHSALPVTGETDRVYRCAADKAIVVLEGGKERFRLVRDNLDDVVVWNPWADKAAGMSDFAPKQAWKNMSSPSHKCFPHVQPLTVTVCIEAGAVTGWQKLDEGDTFEGGQIIKAVL